MICEISSEDPNNLKPSKEDIMEKKNPNKNLESERKTSQTQKQPQSPNKNPQHKSR